MKLNIGAGAERLPGYVRLDANPDTKPDIVGPAYPLTGMADEHFDEVRAVDVLEHLPYRVTGAALAEWARVLAPGGRLFVQVPDTGEIMRRYADYHAALERAAEEDELTRLAGLLAVPAELNDDRYPPSVLVGACWRIMGGQEDGIYAPADRVDVDGWNLHRAMFDLNHLCRHVEDAGLTVERCTTNQHPNLQLWARKPA